jgi:hypothetical protein
MSLTDEHGVNKEVIQKMLRRKLGLYPGNAEQKRYEDLLKGGWVDVDFVVSLEWKNNTHTIQIRQYIGALT